MNIVKVKMADLNTVKAPDRIRTTGLGSCVGIVLYDKVNQIGGLAHIMLPSSDIMKTEQINMAKYADTALPLLMEEMIKAGAKKIHIIAKLAGGSQMFQFKTTNDMMKVGPRNVAASKEWLNKLGIPIVAEDTGGNVGRTIELDTLTGMVSVKTAQQGVTEI